MVNDQDTNAMQRIANFVDNMRFADDERRQREGAETTVRVHSEVVVPSKMVDPSEDGRVVRPGTSEGRGEIAAKMILDAEKFRGEVAKPQGMDNFPQFFSGVQKISKQEVIDDDEFFHVTCHVDKLLTQKIQNGEYVDLEKLLVKDRFHKCSNDDRLEFVTGGGHTFLTTVQDRENRIFGLRK